MLRNRRTIAQRQERRHKRQQRTFGNFLLFVFGRKHPGVGICNILLFLILCFFLARIVSRLFIVNESAKLLFENLSPLVGALIGGALPGIADLLTRNSPGFSMRRSLHKLGWVALTVILATSIPMANHGLNDVSRPCYGILSLNDLPPEVNFLVNIAYYNGTSENAEDINAWPTVLYYEMSDVLQSQDVYLQTLPRTRIVDSEQVAEQINQCTGAVLTIWWGTVTSRVMEIHYQLPNYSQNVYVRGVENTGTDADVPEYILPLPSFDMYLESGGDTEYVLNFVLGVTRFWQEDYQETISLMTSAIDSATAGRAETVSLSSVYTFRAISYLQENAPNEALADMNQVVELRPDEVANYINRALVYLLLRQYEGMIEDYTAAILLEPENEQLYIARGSVYELIQMHTEAEKDYTTALEINPRSWLAYFGLGDIHLALLEISEWAVDYYHAAELTPAGTTFYLFPGALYQLSNYPEANIENLEYDLNIAELYLYRGVKYQFIDNHTTALYDFNRAVELGILETSAKDILYSYRGRTLVRLGKYDEALEDFNQAILADPEDPDPHYSRGNLHSILGRYQEAISDYSQTLEKNPAHVIALLERSYAYYAIGDNTNGAVDLALFAVKLGLSPEEALEMFRAHEVLLETYRNLQQ